MQLKINKNKDYMEERKVENSELFIALQLGIIERKSNLISFEDKLKSYVMRR